MVKFLIALFCLSVSFIFADEPLDLLFSSEIEHLAWDDSDELRVGGVINPLSGNPSLKQIDLIAKGAESIPLFRIFLPCYVPLKSKKKPVPLKTGYAGWVYFPHTRMNVFVHTTKQKKEIKACVVDSNGTVLLYSMKNGKTELCSEPYGICNGISDTPSGRYDYRNLTIRYEDKYLGKFIVNTPEGIERHYPVYREEATSINSKSYSTLFCSLEKEVLQNGKILRYFYDQTSRRLIKVESLDPKEGHIYASIQVNCDPAQSSAIFSTNTHLKATINHNTAQFYKEGKIDNLLNVFFPLHITKADTPFFKDEIATYGKTNFNIGKDRKSSSCLTAFQGKDCDFACLFVESMNASPAYKRKRMSSTHRIHNLFLPGNEDQMEKAYSFHYELSIPGYSDGKSTVNHSDGSSVTYSINKNMLLTSIQYFDSQRALKRVKEFEWDPSQWLKSITIKDAGQVLSKKTFAYDAFGNPIKETFEGNLTGNGVNESYTILRQFSDDGRHLLLNEETEESKSIRYTYIPGTNLLKTKEIRDREHLITRELREYDDCLNLVKIIEEEPATDCKKITTYVLKDAAPFLHMPEVIEESYEEAGIKYLLKRRVLTYDEHGHVSKETIYDAENQQRYCIQRENDTAGNPLSTIDPLGHKTSYSYEKHGLPKTIDDSIKTTAIIYDRKGRKKEVKESGKDGVVRQEKYEYNFYDCLTKKTDNFALDTIYSYDSFQCQPSKTRSPSLYAKDGELPVIETALYDAFGRCIQSSNAKQNTTQTSYNAYGSPVEIRYPDQSKETFSYTKSGLLASHTSPTGLVTRYTYDCLGRIRVKSYEFNEEQLTQETFEYQGLNLLKWSDKEQNLTEYAYDGAGRKIRELKAGRTVTFSYDSLGRLETACKENGTASLITRFEYDDLDQQTAKICQDQSGNILTRVDYTYHPDGTIATIKKNINREEAVETFSYDSQKRRISSRDALDNVTTTVYDDKYLNSFGQHVLRKTEKQPNNVATVETFDTYGRLTMKEILNPEQMVISAEEKSYDACGNLTENIQHVYTDTEYLHSKRTNFSYDACNRVAGFIRGYQSPQERATAYTYYPGGLLKTKTKPDGVVLKYEYDPFGYKRRVSSSDGTIRHQFSHDHLGHLKTTTDELHNIEILCQYDPFGNVIQETLFPNISIKKTYDFMNRPLEITLPDNSKVHYDYDPLFCRKVKRLSSSDEEIYAHAYEDYDLSGNLMVEHLIKNTGKIRYETDLKNRMARIDGTYFQQECQYDDIDNLLKLRTDQQESTYSYDSLNQVLSENYSNQNKSYVHDSAQNRIKDGQIDKVYNELDELEKNSSESYIYDLNGNLCQKSSPSGSINYRYDALNRLVEMIGNDTKIIFTYDPLGRKLIKDKSQLVDGKWEHFSHIKYLYDGSHDIGSLDHKGNIQELRVKGHSTPFSRAVALEFNKNIYVPIHDNQGTIRRLINPSSLELATKNDFSMFGEPLFKEGVFNPWGYSEKRFDPDLNLIDFGKRFYSPVMGRWLTTDPGDFIDGFNLYAYVHNNPFRYIDNDGRFAFVIPLICASFTLGGEIAIGFVAAEAIAEVVIVSICATYLGHVSKELIDMAKSAFNADATKEGKKEKVGPRTEPVDLEEQLALGEAKGAEGKKLTIVRMIQGILQTNG